MLQELTGLVCRLGKIQECHVEKQLSKEPSNL